MSERKRKFKALKRFIYDVNINFPEIIYCSTIKVPVEAKPITKWLDEGGGLGKSDMFY